LGVAEFKVSVTLQLFFFSLASRFLIDMLQKEKPDHFMDIVNTLLAKAIEADDPKLVSNPYLQVKSILEMTNTLSPPTK